MIGLENLIESHKNGKLILFVGSGVSRTLGLPSWDQIIDLQAEELGYHSEIYRTFGEHLALAEYYKLKKKDMSPLLKEMDAKWHSDDIDISKSRIHELIVKAKFELIYTTNYDRWLEKAFNYHGKNCTKIVRVEDFSKTEDNVTRIIKYHGDFDYPDSIVLNESSYYNRLEFDSPLDIKLRSHVLGRSILFVGYSLTDINLRYFFYKLANLWKKNSHGTKPTDSYIFAIPPNPIQKEIFADWNIKMIHSEKDDPTEAYIDLLEHLVHGPAVPSSTSFFSRLFR